MKSYKHPITQEMAREEICLNLIYENLPFLYIYIYMCVYILRRIVKWYPEYIDKEPTLNYCCCNIYSNNLLETICMTISQNNRFNVAILYFCFEISKWKYLSINCCLFSLSPFKIGNEQKIEIKVFQITWMCHK